MAAIRVIRRFGELLDVNMTGAADGDGIVYDAPSGKMVPVAVVGQPGPQGPQGPAGPTGSAGPAGADGATGPQGPAGATGAQGPQGNIGPQGPIGNTGSQGPAGPGVPVGGALGQVLSKKTAADYDTQWVAPSGGGGAVATDPIWDTKGDLAVATGPDAASKLPVGSNGQVLTADSAQATGVKWAAASGGAGGNTLLAYVEKTADTTSLGTSEAAATAILTAPALTFDGSTPILVEFYSPLASAAGGIFHAVLFEDGNPVGDMGEVGGGASAELHGRRRFTPSAGSHTYSARVWVQSGSGSPTVRAGAGGGAGLLVPTYLRLTLDTGGLGPQGPVGPMGPPGGASAPSNELDYAQITADTAAINATTEATSVAVITGNSVTYDGSKVKIEFFYPRLSVGTTSNSIVTAVFYRDSTVIGQVRLLDGTGANNWWDGYAAIFDTPSAGAHTYKVSVFVNTSTVTFRAGAGGSGALAPAFLRVTKDPAIGPQGPAGPAGPGSAVVASTVAGLGAGTDGKVGLIVTGQAALEVIYSAALGKWVSTDTYSIDYQTAPSCIQSASAYPTALLTNGDNVMLIPSFKALYNAGLRPQFAVAAFMRNNVAGTAYVRAALAEFATGDVITIAGSILGGGGEVTDTSTAGAGSAHASDWGDPSPAITAPTKDLVVLVLQAHTSGAATITMPKGAGSMRWVG